MHSTLKRLLTTAALVGGLALANPLYAANPGTVSPAGSPSASAQPSGSHSKRDHGKKMDVEARIKTLHDKLGITADQEDDWNKVAQAMRDNDTNIKSLIEQRHENGESATAVDDLESYRQIAQAHVDGLGKVIEAFKPLYDSLSDDQKKNADEVFGRFEGHRGDPGASQPAAKSAK